MFKSISNEGDILQISVKKTSGQTQWSRWKTMPLLVAALAIGCSSKESDGCYRVEGDGGLQACYCTKDGVAIEGTLTSQGCVNGQQATACSTACSAATVTGLLNPDSPSDNTLTSGGITVRLDLTGQSGQSQVATIDVLNCDQLVGSSSIPSGGSDNFNSGGTSITVNVGAISNGSPKSALVQAVILCGK